MNDSILATIRKMLGPSVVYDYFDTELIIHINTAFNTLNQLGVGPETPFVITGIKEKWSEFTKSSTELEMVKTFIYLRVKLIFDPPLNSSVAQALENTAKELEWRLNVRVDPSNQNGGDS